MSTVICAVSCAQTPVARRIATVRPVSVRASSINSGVQQQTLAACSRTRGPRRPRLRLPLRAAAEDDLEPEEDEEEVEAEIESEEDHQEQEETLWETMKRLAAEAEDKGCATARAADVGCLFLVLRLAVWCYFDPKIVLTGFFVHWDHMSAAERIPFFRCRGSTTWSPGSLPAHQACSSSSSLA